MMIAEIYGTGLNAFYLTARFEIPEYKIHGRLYGYYEHAAIVMEVANH